MDTVVPELEKSSLPSTVWPTVWVALLVFAAVATQLGRFVSHSPTNAFLPTLLFMICLLAAWYDAGTGRIPNSLTYMTITLGFALNAAAALLARTGHAPEWLGATPTFFDCVLGFAILATAGVLALLIAGLGGGDMKLVVGIGTFLGISGSTQVIFWGLSAAVVYALFNLILRGKLNLAMQAISLNILSMLYLRQSSDIQAMPKSKIPLALPMALGIIASRLYPLGVFSA